MSERVILAAMIAGVMTFLLGRWGVPILRRVGVHQLIREEAPAPHRGKTGTPTMGGLLLVPPAAIAALVAAPQRDWRVLLPLVVMLVYGVVGALDDALAIRYRRNLGLRARERLALQLVPAVAVAVYVMHQPDLGPMLLVPGLGAVHLGWAYVVIAALYLVGFTNAVNLTDGLDGLAAGTVAIAATAYAVLTSQAGDAEVAVLAAAVAGACVGFAWFNAHPAAVFMGDVGSNALGAVLAAIAIVTNTEWLLLVIGLVFVLEAASVVLQVAYFKATGGRRIFRMSPLHHHFELSGWTETQTVTRMLIVAIGAAATGLVLAR